MKKSPIAEATFAAFVCVGMILATSTAEASWRVEQLRDADGKPYFGWCDDSSCPTPSRLQPDTGPVVQPMAQPDPFAVPPPALSDSPRRLDLSGLRRPPVAEPESVTTQQRRKVNAPTRSVARSDSAYGSGSTPNQIKRLAETKYARPAPARSSENMVVVPPQPTARQQREISEARRQAMERSARVSPIIVKQGAVVARDGSFAASPAANPMQTPATNSPVMAPANNKVEIILNPGR